MSIWFWNLFQCSNISIKKLLFRMEYFTFQNKIFHYCRRRISGSCSRTRGTWPPCCCTSREPLTSTTWWVHFHFSMKNILTFCYACLDHTEQRMILKSLWLSLTGPRNSNCSLLSLLTSLGLAFTTSLEGQYRAAPHKEMKGKPRIMNWCSHFL